MLAFFHEFQHYLQLQHDEGTSQQSMFDIWVRKKTCVCRRNYSNPMLTADTIRLIFMRENSRRFIKRYFEHTSNSGMWCGKMLDLVSGKRSLKRKEAHEIEKTREHAWEIKPHTDLVMSSPYRRFYPSRTTQTFAMHRIYREEERSETPLFRPVTFSWVKTRAALDATRTMKY